MGRDVTVEDGIKYINDRDLQQVQSILGTEINSLESKDVVMKLVKRYEIQQRELQEQKENVDRATNLLEQAVIKQRELHNVIESLNSLDDYTIMEASKLLEDFDLKAKLSTGQISVDKILQKVIEKAANNQISLQKFTKQQLQAAGYQLRDSDGADSVICNLLMKIESNNKKINSMQSQLNIAQCKNDMNTLKDETLVALERVLPKQFDVGTMKLQREQQMLDVNLVVGSLIEIIETMKNLLIQCKKEISLLKSTKRTETLDKVERDNQKYNRDMLVLKLYSEGQTQAEIAEALNTSRGTVYNILKKYGGK